MGSQTCQAHAGSFLAFSTNTDMEHTNAVSIVDGEN